jgi:hypothetical protein
MMPLRKLLAQEGGLKIISKKKTPALQKSAKARQKLGLWERGKVF